MERTLLVERGFVRKDWRRVGVKENLPEFAEELMKGLELAFDEWHVDGEDDAENLNISCEQLEDGSWKLIAQNDDCDENTTVIKLGHDGYPIKIENRNNTDDEAWFVCTLDRDIGKPYNEMIKLALNTALVLIQPTEE